MIWQTIQGSGVARLSAAINAGSAQTGAPGSTQRSSTESVQAVSQACATTTGQSVRCRCNG